jgi:chromate reductase
MIYKTALICGSLRRASNHAGLLRAFIKESDPRFSFTWIRIDDFPLFNEDIENAGTPPCIQKARNLISQCDAILFGVPEYLHSIPGALKNAMEWLSREDSSHYCPIDNKPCAMVSAGYSMRGLRGQRHFK